MLNNFENEAFTTGLEKFLLLLVDCMRCFPVKGKLVDSLINKEVARLNLLIAGGLYTGGLGVDFCKINVLHKTDFTVDFNSRFVNDKIFYKSLSFFFFRRHQK